MTTLAEWFYEKSRIKPGHGPCCTCQDCGYHHDDCICDLNLDQLESCIKKVQEKFQVNITLELGLLSGWSLSIEDDDYSYLGNEYLEDTIEEGLTEYLVIKGEIDL